MSNIYIQEPPTDGKVLLHTSVGDIDIELWSREAPKACRNFIQLCLEGYYDKTIFHRVVKGFIAQGGDPTGTGMGGESIYGQPFKDEFHTRLRFVRRGLVAMANSGKDDNGSQFFFTLNSTPELQSKHTIFGKVSGNTLYNMIKLEECEVDQNERPLYPHKIVSTEILANPFDDIIPRDVKKTEEKKVEKVVVKGSKNFSLLSFGDEAEEEEQEANLLSKEFCGKSKSSHDLLKNDPKLSSLPAVDKSEFNQTHDDSDDSETKDKKRTCKWDLLKRKFESFTKPCNSKSVDNDDEEVNDELCDRKLEDDDKLSVVKSEFKKLKKQMLCELKKKVQKIEEKKVHENPHVAQFFEEAEKYKSSACQLPKKGTCLREELCLSLLDKFKTRLMSTRERQVSESDSEEKKAEKEDSWLCHELHCQKDEDKPILAKDANLRNEEDWYDIYDPRNPINKRRREAGIIPDDGSSARKKRIN